LEELGNVLG
jgi:hypothetical protein